MTHSADNVRIFWCIVQPVAIGKTAVDQYPQGPRVFRSVGVQVFSQQVNLAIALEAQVLCAFCFFILADLIIGCFFPRFLDAGSMRELYGDHPSWSRLVLWRK